MTDIKCSQEYLYQSDFLSSFLDSANLAIQAVHFECHIRLIEHAVRWTVSGDDLETTAGLESTSLSFQGLVN